MSRKSCSSTFLKKHGVVDVYPSRHLFERAVERNIGYDDILWVCKDILKDYRGSTFNTSKYKAIWKELVVCAEITIGAVTGRRQLILKTVFDRGMPDDMFDVVIKL